MWYLKLKALQDCNLPKAQIGKRGRDLNLKKNLAIWGTVAMNRVGAHLLSREGQKKMSKMKELLQLTSLKVLIDRVASLLS